MVFEIREQSDKAPDAIARVAQQSSVHREALRSRFARRRSMMGSGRAPRRPMRDGSPRSSGRFASRVGPTRSSSPSPLFARELDPRPPR